MTSNQKKYVITFFIGAAIVVVGGFFVSFEKNGIFAAFILLGGLVAIIGRYLYQFETINIGDKRYNEGKKEKETKEFAEYENIKNNFFQITALMYEKKSYLKKSRDAKIKILTDMNNLADKIITHSYISADNKFYSKLRTLKMHVISPYLIALQSDPKEKVSGKINGIEINNFEEFESIMYDEYKKLNLHDSIQELPLKKFKIKKN